jgi:hypothetical protein
VRSADGRAWTWKGTQARDREVWGEEQGPFQMIINGAVVGGGWAHDFSRGQPLTGVCRWNTLGLRISLG